jgi:hypothetical protein
MFSTKTSKYWSIVSSQPTEIYHGRNIALKGDWITEEYDEARRCDWKEKKMEHQRDL